MLHKIWNASRLVKGWTIDESLPNPNEIAIKWFESRFNEALVEIENNFTQYRLSEALMAIYKLVWDDFCSAYLEMVKPAYQQPIDAATYQQTVSFFEEILKLLHPFMPFITEELWHDELFGKRSEADCCIVAKMPKSGEFDARLLAEVNAVQQVIAGIRNVRNTKQLSPKEALPLYLVANSGIDYRPYLPLLTKLANLSEVNFCEEKLTGAVGFMVSTDEFYIPLVENIDKDEEIKRLTAEKNYLEGFLKSVNAKLGNEKFVQNAKPEVVQNEQKKKADAEAKLNIVNEQLSSLAN